MSHRRATLTALTLVLLVALAAPAPAHAFSLNPADWVVDGFKAILGFIFGDIDQLGRKLIMLLLAVPLLSDTQNFPRLNAYREHVTFGAWAILLLTPVIAAVRYYLAGLSSASAYAGITGIIRGVGAVVMLLMFPTAFDQISRFVNAFTYALTDNSVVGSGLGNSAVKVVSTQGFDEGGIALIIGVIAISIAIILILVKVIITALLAVLFVASPLAIALWPVDEMAWALRSLLQAIMGLLAFPVLWALCFGTFAVLSSDALFPGDHGDAINAALAPMIGLASLLVAFRLPFAVLGQATKAGLMPGVSRTVMTVRMARGGGRAPRPKVPVPARAAA